MGVCVWRLNYLDLVHEIVPWPVIVGLRTDILVTLFALRGKCPDKPVADQDKNMISIISKLSFCLLTRPVFVQ